MIHPTGEHSIERPSQLSRPKSTGDCDQQDRGFQYTGDMELDPPQMGKPETLFERVGGVSDGEEFFHRLVEQFYLHVAQTPDLIRLYPDPVDLRPARDRLALFLVQYWGGPSTYSQTRGHPRLRMRHFPFQIGEYERDLWLGCMHKALDDLAVEPEVRAELENHFLLAAEHLVNT